MHTKNPLETSQTRHLLYQIVRAQYWRKSFCHHLTWPPKQNLPHSGRPRWISSAFGASISLVLIGGNSTNSDLSSRNIEVLAHPPFPTPPWTFLSIRVCPWVVILVKYCMLGRNLLLIYQILIYCCQERAGTANRFTSIIRRK